MKDNRLPCGKMISDSFESLKINFSELLKMYSIYLGAVLLVTILCVISSLIPPVLIIVGIICVIPLMVVGLAINIGTIKMLYESFNGTKIKFTEAFKYGFKKFFKVLGVNLLSGILVSLPIIVIEVIVLVSVLFGPTIEVEEGSTVLILIIIGAVIGITIISLLVCFFATFFIFAPIIAVIREDVGVWGSIRYSFKMFKKRKAKLFGRIILLGLLTSVMMSAVAIVGLIPILGQIVLIPVSLFLSAFMYSGLINIFISYDEESVGKINVMEENNI